MRVLSKPRMGGKTTALVEAMGKDSQLFYVAPTHAQCNIAARRASDMGLTIEAHRFLTARQLADGNYFVGYKTPPRLVLDEADGVISILAGNAEIKLIALTEK